MISILSLFLDFVLHLGLPEKLRRGIDESADHNYISTMLPSILISPILSPDSAVWEFAWANRSKVDISLQNDYEVCDQHLQ